MTFIQGEAQRKGVHTIEMLATKGGPVTQVCHFSDAFRSLFDPFSVDVCQIRLKNTLFPAPFGLISSAVLDELPDFA